MFLAIFTFVSFCAMAVMELLFLYVLLTGQIGGLVMMIFMTPMFLFVYERQRQIFKILGKPFPPIIHLFKPSEEETQ